MGENIFCGWFGAEDQNHYVGNSGNITWKPVLNKKVAMKML